ERLTLQDEELAASEARNAGRPRSTVDQRELAEIIAGSCGQEIDFASRVVALVDTDLARQDDVQPVRGIALAENYLPCFQLPRPACGSYRSELLRRQIGEQRDPGQKDFCGRCRAHSGNSALQRLDHATRIRLPVPARLASVATALVKF